MRNCHIQERMIPQQVVPYQEETGKKQRTGIPDERFPFLGSVPIGEPVCFTGLFSDLKKQNAPDFFSSLGNVWHSLIPCHLLVAFGPRTREKRNTRFFTFRTSPLLLLAFSIPPSTSACYHALTSSHVLCARAESSSPCGRGSGKATSRPRT